MRTGNTNKKKIARRDRHDIDNVVISQANDDRAWDSPVRVKRAKSMPLLISRELAARAAFLANLHGEPGLDQWVERVLRERVELEEHAFTRAKKDLAS